MFGTEHQLLKTEDDMYVEQFGVVYRKEKQVSLEKSGEKNAGIVVKEEEDSEIEFDILESIHQSAENGGKWGTTDTFNSTDKTFNPINMI